MNTLFENAAYVMQLRQSIIVSIKSRSVTMIPMTPKGFSRSFTSWTTNMKSQHLHHSPITYDNCKRLFHNCLNVIVKWNAKAKVFNAMFTIDRKLTNLPQVSIDL